MKNKVWKVQFGGVVLFRRVGWYYRGWWPRFDNHWGSYVKSVALQVGPVQFTFDIFQ